MKIKHLFALMVLVSITFVACTKEEKEEEVKPPVDKHSLLYDKQWYNSPNQGRGDHYFSSDGTVTWSLLPAQGTWEWKPNDSLKVSFPGYDDVTFWFKTIEENHMEYWPTFEPEANTYTFSTTKP